MKLRNDRSRRRSMRFASHVLLVGMLAALGAQAQVASLKLAPQPLASAIDKLAESTGASIVADPRLLAGLQANALTGDLNTEQALDRLLSGTGLAWRRQGDGAKASYVIVDASVPPVSTQDPPKPAPVSLDKVTVTGSYLSQAYRQGVNPVQVISADAIRTGGFSTVADVLRSISSFNGRSQNENTLANWSSGSSALGLHGLSPKYTVVLLNGRRISGYGFPTMLSETPTDINTLPLHALARIEVLKEGASAVYGSDAVAGVVNLITKTGPQPLTIGGGTGFATEGGAAERRANLSEGWGDLDKDGYNVFVDLEAYKRDPLWQSQRALTRSGDYRGQPGGALYGWEAAADYIDSKGVSHALLDANGNCPTGLSLINSADLGTGVQGTTCGHSLTNVFSSMAGSERYVASIDATFKLSENTEAFIEGLYSHTYNRLNFYIPYASLGSGRLAIDPASGLPETVSNTLSASSPNNLTGQDIALDYSFTRLGAQTRNTSTDQYRVVAGLRGSWNRWKWESGLYQSANRVEQRDSGGIANWHTLLSAIQDGSYNLFDEGATSQSVIDSIALSTRKRGQYTLKGADFRASGPLFELPAGTVNLAVGAEWRQESDWVRVPDEISSGLVLRPHIQSIDNSRDISAAYAEFNVPLLSTLELQVAGRADHYNDTGSAFSPRASLRWQPLDQLVFRGSYSRGFRAPSLAEASDSNYVLGTDTVYDAARGKRVQVAQISTGGSDLKPEHTRNTSFGVVYSPDDRTDISLDYYRILIKDVIGFENADDIIARNDPSQVIRDSNGYVTLFYRSLQNLSEMHTSGIQLEASRVFPSERFGDWKVGTDLTYVRDYYLQLVPNGPLVDIAGTNLQSQALPRLRGNTTLSWNKGDWSSQLDWNYTGGYAQKMLSTTTVPSRISHYSQFDLYTGYTGFHNLTVFASVDNLFNRTPPYDPAGYSTYAYSVRAPYDVGLYNLLGRYVRIGFEYKFE